MMAADTKLHEAVRYGDSNLVESALEDEADPNSIGLYGWSPMHEAASNGDTDILDLLIQFKGDPNCSDDLEGCTPVHYAAREGHMDCLRALLKAGGRYDVENNGGKTPLDEASEECWPILDKEKTKSLLNMTLDAARITVSKHKPEGLQSQRSGVTTTEEAVGSQESSGRIKSPRAWDSIKVLESKKTSGKESMTGTLQLSFEYNSKTKTFKIRVWSLQDILLPPAEFSNLSRIYIRGHLLPDKKGETKRKTDEIRIDDPTKMKNSLVTLRRKGVRDSFKAIFLPSTFKFSKALEYQNVTQEMVDTKTVHIAVCVRQRYSTKTIPVAMIQLPMKEAVRKLIKEKYHLHSCINYSMPTNIHAYNPHDIVVITEGMYSNRTTSHPTLRTKSGQSLDVVESDARASSDINLQAVRCLSIESVPSASVEMEPLQKETALDDLLEVSVIRDDSADATSHKKKVTVVEVHELPSHPATPLPGIIDDGELTDVSVISSPRKSPDSATIDMEGLETINLDGEPLQASSTPVKSRHAKIKHGFENPHITIVDDADDDEDFEVSIDKMDHGKWTRDKDAIIDIGVGDHGDDNKRKGIRGHLFRKRDKHKKKSKGDGLDNPGYVVDMRTGKRSLLGEFNDGPNRTGQLEMLEILSDEEADMRFSRNKNGTNADKGVSQNGNHQKETVIDVALSSDMPEIGKRTKTYDVRGAMKKEDIVVSNARRKLPTKGVGRTEKSKTEIEVPRREISSPVPVIHVECVDEVERSLSPGSRSPRSPRSPRQARRISPIPIISNSGRMSSQQDFPPPITQGMPHTDLTSARDVSGTWSRHKKGTSAVKQKDSHSPVDVKFISETDDSVSSSKPRKSRSKTGDGKNRSKSPGRRHKKEGVEEDEAGFEMLSLWNDEEWRKKLATPTFKLQMFQRTSDDPHPSSPLLKRYHGADPARGVIHNPAYVPETPPNQTDIDTPSKVNGGARVKRRLHKDTTESDHSKDDRTVDIESSPSITKISQSWL